MVAARDVSGMGDRLTRLILVRHGETEGQSSIRYYGVTDVPLSDRANSDDQDSQLIRHRLFPTRHRAIGVRS